MNAPYLPFVGGNAGVVTWSRGVKAIAAAPPAEARNIRVQYMEGGADRNREYIMATQKLCYYVGMEHIRTNDWRWNLAPVAPAMNRHDAEHTYGMGRANGMYETIRGLIKPTIDYAASQGVSVNVLNHGGPSLATVIDEVSVIGAVLDELADCLKETASLNPRNNPQAAELVCYTILNERIIPNSKRAAISRETREKLYRVGEWYNNKTSSSGRAVTQGILKFYDEIVSLGSLGGVLAELTALTETMLLMLWRFGYCDLPAGEIHGRALGAWTVVDDRGEDALARRPRELYNSGLGRPTLIAVPIVSALAVAISSRDLSMEHWWITYALVVAFVVDAYLWLLVEGWDVLRPDIEGIRLGPLFCVDGGWVGRTIETTTQYQSPSELLRTSGPEVEGSHTLWSVDGEWTESCITRFIEGLGGSPLKKGTVMTVMAAIDLGCLTAEGKPKIQPHRTGQRPTETAAYIEDDLFGNVLPWRYIGQSPLAATDGFLLAYCDSKTSE